MQYRATTILIICCIFANTFFVACSTTAGTVINPELTDAQLQILEYFDEVALGSEFGAGKGIVKKWHDDIFIYIDGDYTAEDYKAITENANFLSGLAGVPDICITEDVNLANWNMHFISQQEMNEVMLQYNNDTVWGFATVWWSKGEYIIRKAEIYIVTDTQTQSQRLHAILEEMTQSLGLLNDSYLYEDSIFQNEYYPDVTALSDIDLQLLNLLYNDEIKPGMQREEALSKIRELLLSFDR